MLIVDLKKLVDKKTHHPEITQKVVAEVLHFFGGSFLTIVAISRKTPPIIKKGRGSIVFKVDCFKKIR
jgi:hypothetical protein